MAGDGLCSSVPEVSLGHTNEDTPDVNVKAAPKGTGVFLPRTSTAMLNRHPHPPPPPPAAAAAADSAHVQHHSSRHGAPGSCYAQQPVLSSGAGVWHAQSSNRPASSSPEALDGFNRRISGAEDSFRHLQPPPPPPRSRPQQQQRYAIPSSQQQQQHWDEPPGLLAELASSCPPGPTTSIIPWMRARSLPGALAEHTSALAAAAAALHSELCAADPGLMQQQQQYQQMGSSQQVFNASNVLLPDSGTAQLTELQLQPNASAAIDQAGSSNEASGMFNSNSVCNTVFAAQDRQHDQDMLQLMQQQQVSQTVLGSSPQQNSGMLFMSGAPQLAGMKLTSDTPSIELEGLLSFDLSSSSLPSMPAKRVPPQAQPQQQQQQQQLQQQQLAQGSFFPAIGTGGGVFPAMSSSGYSSSSSSSVKATSNNSSPFLSAAYQQGQQQQQQLGMQQYSSTEFALAPRTNSMPADGALMGVLAMPRAMGASSSSHNIAPQWQQQPSSQQLLPEQQLQYCQQQQQQFQFDRLSDPLPQMDPALLDMQRQLAAVSLTADMPLAPAAAAASSSRMPVMMQSGCSSVTNSDVLGSPPPGPGSPLCNVIDGEIMRLLKLRERLTAVSAAVPSGSPVAAACSAAVQTHEEAMKQALAARAALQVSSLAFDAAAGTNTINSNSSSMYIGNANSQQMVVMPDMNANSAAAAGLFGMSGGLGGGAVWDAGGSSAQVLNAHNTYPAGSFNMQQQVTLQQQQQQQGQQLLQEQQQQQQIMKLQQELAELQSIVNDGLRQLM